MNNLNNIAETLGVDGKDLAGCCRSANVNPWSFHKPVNSPGIQALSEEDFYHLNSGFYLYPVSWPQEMVYFLQHRNTNLLWTYEDRIAPYRMSDFLRYEHLGDMDFSVAWMNNSVGSQGSTLRLLTNYNIWDFVQWGYFESINTNNLDIVYLFYPVGTDYDGSDTQGVWLYKVCSYSTYDDRLNFTIPSDLPNGDYELRLAFTTATGSLNDGQCIYYRADNYSYIVGNWYCYPPDSKCIFTVGSTPPTPSVDFFSLVDFAFSDCHYDYWFPTLSNVEIINNIELLDTTREASIHIEYKYNNCSLPVTLREANVVLNADNPVQSVWIGSKEEITTITEARLEDGYISIEVSASIKIGQQVQTKTWNETIEKTL